MEAYNKVHMAPDAIASWSRTKIAECIDVPNMLQKYISIEWIGP